MLVYPPEGHKTDSKEIFILGSANLSCLINDSAIALEKNGNFCKLIQLKLGENKIQINIDGKSFTRTVYGVLNINNNPNPIAYAQPYRAFTKQANSNNGRVAERTSSGNILQSILISNKDISIPLNVLPDYRLEKINAYHYRLDLGIMEQDLDWIHYSELNPEIKIEQISDTIFDIKFQKPIINHKIKFKNQVLNISFTFSELPLLVCIDPGHGGSQIGAISPKGIFEKDLNLSLAIKLAAELNHQGVKTILTRDHDTEKSLSERVKISQKNKCTLFISLHHNALPDSRDPNKESGFSCHYFHEHSYRLAKFISFKLKSSSSQNFAGIYKQNLHVLRENPDTISVLIELGYLIHPLESELLCKKSFQTKTARILAKALLEFHRNQNFLNESSINALKT
ncbi:MAG: N-acetylmuramoyl-L-alanine amidase [Proteobacteria bacterium]|nr:N-acetylmuramoyl-L-alanine amidase [Pseudomonadota bacterium]